MASVSVSELQSRLEHYIHLARQGEEVVVSEDGVPAVRISPVSSDGCSDSERKLVAQGRLRAPRRPFEPNALSDFLTTRKRLPADRQLTRDLAQAVTDSRDDN